jgi:hypothetical protein
VGGNSSNRTAKNVENQAILSTQAFNLTQEVKMVYLEKAIYLSDYKIEITFNTGEVGIVDLSDVPELFEAAKPLKELENFRQFYLDEWPTLVWPCGFDLAPEMLYQRVTGKDSYWQQAG